MIDIIEQRPIQNPFFVIRMVSLRENTGRNTIETAHRQRADEEAGRRKRERETRTMEEGQGFCLVDTLLVALVKCCRFLMH